MADIYFPVQCDDDTMGTDSALRKWASHILEGTTKIDRSINIAKDYELQREKVGFTNVVEEKLIWLRNRWLKDKRMKKISEYGPMKT